MAKITGMADINGPGASEVVLDCGGRRIVLRETGRVVTRITRTSVERREIGADGDISADLAWIMEDDRATAAVPERSALDEAVLQTADAWFVALDSRPERVATAAVELLSAIRARKEARTPDAR